MKNGNTLREMITGTNIFNNVDPGWETETRWRNYLKQVAGFDRTRKVKNRKLWW